MKTNHGFWLHHIRSSRSSVNGFFFLRECDCSVCGYTVRMEKDLCPSCRAVMDLDVPESVKQKITDYALKASQVTDEESVDLDEVMKVIRKDLKIGRSGE